MPAIQNGLHQLVPHIAQLQGKEGGLLVSKVEKDVVPIPKGELL